VADPRRGRRDRRRAAAENGRPSSTTKAVQVCTTALLCYSACTSSARGGDFSARRPAPGAALNLDSRDEGGAERMEGCHREGVGGSWHLVGDVPRRHAGRAWTRRRHPAPQAHPAAECSKSFLIAWRSK